MGERTEARRVRTAYNYKGLRWGRGKRRPRALSFWLGLHWSSGGGTLPFTHGVWSSTMLMVMLGCQCEMTSTGP